MSGLFIPADGAESFLRRAKRDGFSMQDSLINPTIGAQISDELRDAGQLFDLNELQLTTTFEEEKMYLTHFLWRSLSRAITGIERSDDTHLPLFSVRVFDSGKCGTTIHRNDDSVGPWAVGITLRGSAPFSVYEHSQLPRGQVIDLYGDAQDPTPLATMDAGPGSAWTLYTERQQVPHSSGVVASPEQRELLLFYGLKY